MISSWPGLEEGNLVGPGDLAMTIDYRDVLTEILYYRLNNPAGEDYHWVKILSFQPMPT